MLVALATFNEIGNLPHLVDEIHSYLPTCDLLVVDDNSPDGTGRWCDERAAECERFRVIHRTEKRGLGTATLTAIRYAIDHGYQQLITMDADFSHSPADLPRVSSHAAEADVVIGSRYCPGGRILGWPWYRRTISRLVNAATRRSLHLAPRDCSGAFRCYAVEQLAQLDLPAVQAEGYAYLEEILWRLGRQGASMLEVPIVFQQRRSGSSKASLGEAVEKFRTLWRLTRERRAGERS